MTVTVEQFQKDATPWLAKLKAIGESLILVDGEETFEVRNAGTVILDAAVRDWQKVLPKRDIIVGDPEDLVHLDRSSEWLP